MRGTGSVYRRGSVWWIVYHHRGKRYRESAESELKKDANALLRKRLAEIGSGRFVGRDEEKVTLADLKGIQEDDYRVNGKKSLDRILDCWKALEAYFGADCRALDITADRVNAYIRHRQDLGRGNSTIRNEVNALRRSLRLAHQAGRLSGVQYIPNVTVTAVREGFLTNSELEAVQAELPAYLAPVAEFAFLTGWRKREVLTLQWSQVDFETGSIRLSAAKSKNREGRTFPFHVLPALHHLLNRQLERTRKLEKEQGEIIPWVFHRNGDQIRSMKTAWKGACRRAGLEGTLFHDLRRCAVMNLEKAGVSRSVAMKLTGHKTESVYRRYAIADKAAQEEGVEKLARLFEGTQEARKTIPLRRAADQ